ncbi:MAG: prolyl oligopeptidase family serine peptidase [Candidatus Sulfotelmatobacter sp.]|jgi:dipeptidyl aminopeptidase/acylaminoacyl peptidase
MNVAKHSSDRLSAIERFNKIYFAAILIFFSACEGLAQNKSKLTLDECFNSVSYPSVTLSPDGKSVVIGTERADWEQQIFRNDLWLYRDDGKSGSLIQLTQSGHDTEPKWSPDGRWIAFLSERKASREKDSDSSDDKDDKGDISQIYLISPTGGEAVAMTQGQEEVHAFSWSADSTTIYYATRTPWSKTQKDDYKKEWKDVVQYRTAERGDTVFALDVAATLAEHQAAPAKTETEAEKESDSTPGARAIATSTLRVDDLITSPDGSKLAFPTNAINQRQEKFEDSEIYVLELTGRSKNSGKEKDQVAAAASDENNSPPQEPRRLTHNQAQETKLHWASDSRHIFFTVEVGDVSGPYRDLQPHLYWVDSETGTVEQWGKDFGGPVESYGTYGNGALVTARLGTEVQIYAASKPPALLERFNGLPGTYENLSTGLRSLRVAYVYSSLTQPAEVYLAEGPNRLRKEDYARPITAFNAFLAEKTLPQGKPYRWKADDGTMIEGMLIYPPGKFEQKNLPVFTFIHGGPADADGNHFATDWYQWSALAATNGWLVFEPNYRGSTGYGDRFLMQIVPQIVSRPGKDILEGVDALVKDGIADPDHLAVGGYSYGGYMTNWLITQTTRFKAAVTGAGAVEHVGNWGNDDTTYDDAYFLGGRPWEAQQRYHDEAAIFQIDKVRTPTHMVAGADDVRVAVLEDYLLEHALYSLGIPNALLIFPGEGHGLGKNPWHGKIKVREELKWLQKYGGVSAGN